MKDVTDSLTSENSVKGINRLEMKIRKIDLKQINDDFKLSLIKNNQISVKENRETKSAQLPNLSSDYKYLKEESNQNYQDNKKDILDSEQELNETNEKTHSTFINNKKQIFNFSNYSKRNNTTTLAKNHTVKDDQINYLKNLSSKNIRTQRLLTEKSDNTVNTLNTFQSTISHQNFAASVFSKTIFHSGRGYFIKSKFLLLVSILFMSLSVLIIKILFQSHQQNMSHSHNTINFFCGFYMFIFSILFIKIDNINLGLKKNFNKLEVDYLLIRALSGFLAIHFTIRALDSMRLVSAATLIYLSPVISTFILMIHKREKVKINDKICLLGSFFIIIIFFIQQIYFDCKDNKNLTSREEDKDYFYNYIESENFFKDSFSGIIFSLIAAVLNSINSVIDKKVCYEYHSYVILFTTGTLSIILTPIFMSMSQDQFFMNPRNFVLLFVLGSCIFLGSYYTHKTIEANCLLINSSLHNISLIMAYLYAFIIFDEPLTVYDGVSAILIILVNFYMKLRAEECEEIDNSDNL
jgi:drug/metabolite transporter (DMT)-like permease